jgi:N-acetylglucosamine-6-phosphate deacetylase
VIAIDGAYIVCGASSPVPSRLVIDDGKIIGIGTRDSVAIPAGTEVIDAFGRRVLAGFIDIHNHGGAGASFMDADQDAFATICRHAARHGITRLLATVDSAPIEHMTYVLGELGRYQDVPDGARMEGIHVEGPYLAEARAGSQPGEHFRVPAVDEIDRMHEASKGRMKQMTVAPELPGAMGVIEYLGSIGVIAAMGHSDADYHTALRAVAHGASVGTHVFSSMPTLHHRDLSVTTVALTDDRVVAEVIADGVHIHPAMVRMLVRCKQPWRVALVSNAIFAAGLDDGIYEKGGRNVVVRRGLAHIGEAGGPLAGGTVGMDRAFSNLLQYADITLHEASLMASSVPSWVLGVDGQAGQIKVRYDADLVILDHDGTAWMTIIGGKVVYRKEE